MTNLRRFSIPLLMATGLSASTVRGSAQFVKFTFAPPDGVRFEEIHRHKQQILVGLPEPEANIEEQRTQYAIRRTTAGYSVVATPVTRVPLDQRGSNLLAAVASQATVTYDLDTLGRLVRVRGAEEAFETLKNALSPELTSALLSGFGQSGKTATQLVAEGWIGRSMLGYLAGRTIKVDTTYTARLSTPLPVGGTMLADLSMRVGGPKACGAHTCMQVSTAYTSSDPTIGSQLSAFMRGLILQVGGALLTVLRPQDQDVNSSIDVARLVPEFEFSDTKFTLENLRLIDPETGLLYSEIQTQTIESRLALHGEGKSPMTIRNSDTFLYEFQGLR